MLKNSIVGLLMGIGIAFSQSTYLTSTEPSKATIDGVEYYQISKCPELAWFRGQVNSGSTEINAILTKNVNCYTNSSIDTSLASSWEPIAYDSVNAYKGIFDGRGFKISNICVRTSETKNSLYGLFGFVKGTIKNLTTTKFYFDIPEKTSSYFAGGIAAKTLPGALLDNVNAYGFIGKYSSITSSENYGRIVGVSRGSILRNIAIDSSFFYVKTYGTYTNYPYMIGSLLESSEIRSCRFSDLGRGFFKTGTDSKIINSFMSSVTDGFGISYDWYLKNPTSEKLASMTFDNYWQQLTTADDGSYFAFNGKLKYAGTQVSSGFSSGFMNGDSLIFVYLPEWDSLLPVFIEFKSFLNDWVRKQPKDSSFKTWDYKQIEADKRTKKAVLMDEYSFTNRKFWIDEGNYDVSWYSKSGKNFAISNISQLAGLSVICNGFHGYEADNFEGKTVNLSSDLKESEVSKYLWWPIGESPVHPFLGTFNGNKKVVEGLKTDSLSMYSSLFGVFKGTMKNLTLKNINFGGSWGAGIAIQNYGSIDSCYIDGILKNRIGAAGFVVLNEEGSIIKNSTFNGTFSVYTQDTTKFSLGGTYSDVDVVAAGIAGKNSGLIKNVFVNGISEIDMYNKKSSSKVYRIYQGGIVAQNLLNGEVSVSHNAASLKQVNVLDYSSNSWDKHIIYAGGIAGHNLGKIEKAIVDSDSLIFKAYGSGGIAGYNDGSINRAYNKTFDVTFCGYYTGGLVGQVGANSTIKNSLNESPAKENTSCPVDTWNTLYKYLGGLVGGGSISKVQNSFNAGNFTIGGHVTKGIGDGTHYNCFNIGKLDSVYTGPGYFGSFDLFGGSNYNSYSVIQADSNRYDSKKAVDSYTFDSDAATGKAKMTYYDMDYSEEVQGTLLEALNSWVRYQKELDAGADFDFWKQGERYPEFDIEWEVSEPSSSSSTPIFESSSSMTIVSSSSFTNSSSTSSANAESSSSLNTSSSSMEFKSSSSTTTLVGNVAKPTFNIAVNGMTLTVTNAQEGTIRIFDALGHLVNTKQIVGPATSVTLQTSGGYIVRINGSSQMVNLK